MLRESYRQDDKVKKRTVANLSNWHTELVENFRALLKRGTVVDRIEESFDVLRSRPPGHVAAVLGSLRKTRLEQLTGDRGLLEHALILAMIVARITDPQSKLATARALSYDVTSTSFEGRTCPLAKLGHNRYGKKGKFQIVLGLLCTKQGCPVAVEVFPGDTGDPSTLEAQIKKIQDKFGLERVILVGDRGVIVEGLEWITALRFAQIRELVESGLL